MRRRDGKWPAMGQKDQKAIAKRLAAANRLGLAVARSPRRGKTTRPDAPNAGKINDLSPRPLATQ